MLRVSLGDLVREQLLGPLRQKLPALSTPCGFSKEDCGKFIQAGMIGLLSRRPQLCSSQGRKAIHPRIRLFLVIGKRQYLFAITSERGCPTSSWIWALGALVARSGSYSESR
jgi:hypothetical protein